MELAKKNLELIETVPELQKPRADGYPHSLGRLLSENLEQVEQAVKTRMSREVTQQLESLNGAGYGNIVVKYALKNAWDPVLAHRWYTGTVVDPEKILACAEGIRRIEGSEESSLATAKSEQEAPQELDANEDSIEQAEEPSRYEVKEEVTREPKLLKEPSEPQSLEDYKRLIQRHFAKRATKTGKLGLALKYIQEVEPKLTTVGVAKMYWEDGCLKEVR